MDDRNEIDLVYKRIEFLYGLLPEPADNNDTAKYEDLVSNIKMLAERYVDLSAHINVDFDNNIINKHLDEINNEDILNIILTGYIANASLAYQYYYCKSFEAATKILAPCISFFLEFNKKTYNNDPDFHKFLSISQHIYALSLIECGILDIPVNIGMALLRFSPHLSHKIFERISIYYFNLYGYSLITASNLDNLAFSYKIIGESTYAARIYALSMHVRNVLAFNVDKYQEKPLKRNITSLEDFLSLEGTMDDSEKLLEAYFNSKGIAEPDREELIRKIDLLAKRTKPAKTLPRQAPERYDERPVRADLKRKEKIGEFMLRVWGEYMDPDVGPLSRKTLRKLDDSADIGIENWLSYHKALPEGVYLPTLAELNDVALMADPTADRKRLLTARSYRTNPKK